MTKPIPDKAEVALEYPDKLYIGTFELSTHPETPFKVVLNEAIELGKSFGGTEGYRFVNGVLEKIAARLRPDEVGRARNPA